MPTKHEQQQPTEPSSDIATIRNILMGQHIADYERQFVQVGEEIDANKQHFIQELAHFSQETDERFARLEKEMNERFERLEKILNDHVRRLDARLLEVTKTDKQNLGQMLADISKKLIVE